VELLDARIGSDRSLTAKTLALDLTNFYDSLAAGKHAFSFVGNGLVQSVVSLSRKYDHGVDGRGKSR